MHINKNKLAFSLIELSVVILIIGILIIGVSKGSRIIKESKIKTAQSLTFSSPIASTEGLTLWLESTMDKSFDEGQAIDTALDVAGTIATWNDINPQATSGNNATQASAANKPRYVEDGLNGLPVLDFDADSAPNAATSSDYVDLSSGSSLGLVNSDYEIFLVYRSDVSGVTPQFLISGIGYEVQLNGISTGSAIDGIRFIANANLIDYEFPANNLDPLAAQIISARVQGGSGYLRIAGEDRVGPVANSNSLNETNTVSLGVRDNQTLPFNGVIAEVIIFDRALKSSERVSIEEYLSAKWGITL